jgi:acetyltransferase-like isoleucine patch superfamily enzyme
VRQLSRLFLSGIDTFRNLTIKFGELWRLFVAYVFYNEYSIARFFRKQGAQVGENCRILIRSLGDEPYLVKISDHVTIAGGVTFITHDGGAWIAREQVPDLQVFGPIIIDRNCVIGQRAILLPNIHIGENSIIGAGSVVINDIPPNTVAIGVPARPIGSVAKYSQKCIERWEQQKPKNIIIEEGKDWWHSKNNARNRMELRKHLIELYWGKNSSPTELNQKDAGTENK